MIHQIARIHCTLGRAPRPTGAAAQHSPDMRTVTLRAAATTGS